MAIWFAWGAWQPLPVIQDEYSYVLQSQIFARGEWTAPPQDFNYLTNRAGVDAYWRTRVKTNARYENIWTLGMRGIHDSGMVGPTTDAARRRTLEQIFADQRSMLGHYVDRDLDRVPQVFTPYKEVLDIYRSGLKVPDDVTLMWPDDNFG